MPLTPEAARELRGRTSPVYDEPPRERYARALAWVGHEVDVRLRTGTTVSGSVVGVATLPHVRLPQLDSGILLLRRGGPTVDVYEGHVLGLVCQISEVSDRDRDLGHDRRERFG